MLTRSNLYFIAIIPPEPIYSEAKEFQRYIADNFRSKEALKPPSHITLIPPFQQPASREEELIRFTENFASKQNSFELSAEGFGSFGLGVIYIAFEKNEHLKKMERELTLSFYKKFKVERGPSHAFTPHITIAYKDLTPPMFPLAWEKFQHKIYRRKWMLHDVCLLRHSGKEWEIRKRIDVGTISKDILELGF